MTRDRGDHDAPGDRSRRPGVVARRVAAPPGAAARDEAQAERSEEPFALLRAAIEQRERPERHGA